MATQVQHRRGSTAQHAAFTGANGEVTVDTTKKTAVVHDGVTAGGTPLATERGVQNSTSVSCVAAGTADAITGAFSPAIAALVNGATVLVRAGAANTSMTPTFKADGTAAKTIVKGSNIALNPGDISGAGHWLCLTLDTVLDKWVLENPARGVAVAVGIGLTSRVKGLLGNVNAATPLTKFDLSADEVVLVDVNGATVRRTVTGILTCDLGLAGPAANGRDQAGAFVANSWINLFYVWNGVVLALVASTASHTAGPVLPAGYTHWCYATTIRWNASSNIFRVVVAGATNFYDIDSSSALIAAGTATSFTPISLSSWVPQNAMSVGLSGVFTANHNVVGAGFILSFRPTGSLASFGKRSAYITTPVTGSTLYQQIDFEIKPGNNSSIDYMLSAVPANNGGVFLDVFFYRVPNGDV